METSLSNQCSIGYPREEDSLVYHCYTFACLCFIGWASCFTIDQRTQFALSTLRTLARRFDFTLCPTSSWHPAANVWCMDSKKQLLWPTPINHGLSLHRSFYLACVQHLKSLWKRCQQTLTTVSFCVFSLSFCVFSVSFCPTRQLTPKWRTRYARSPVFIRSWIKIDLC